MAISETTRGWLQLKAGEGVIFNDVDISDELKDLAIVFRADRFDRSYRENMTESERRIDGQLTDYMNAFEIKSRHCERLEAERRDLLHVLKEALRETGCDGDLCMYRWHDEARLVIAKMEGR